MFPKLTFDENAIRENSKKKNTNPEQTERFIKHLKGFDFTDKLHGYLDNMNCFSFIYNELGANSPQPRIIDYGYGCTVESIEKYILSKYPDDDPTPYMLEFGTIPTDYENIYKDGTYINLKGEKTHQDWDCVEGIDEEMKHMEIEGKFISFSVLELLEYNPNGKNVTKNED